MKSIVQNQTQRTDKYLFFKKKSMGREGFEPSTTRASVECSPELSYQPMTLYDFGEINDL
mgnify:CR=1 FL=1